MNKDIADVIRQKLKELEQNLIYLKQVSYNVDIKNLKSDMIRYWGIERGIQISIESIIDIANIIISVSDREKPTTYRESMAILSDIGVVSKNFSRRLGNMVGFRNILVHDYTKIDPEVIMGILEEDMDDFIKYSVDIHKWLENNLT